MNIKSLGYVGIGTNDPRAWLDFAVEVLGMMPARAVPGEGWGEPGQPRPDTGRPEGVAEDDDDGSCDETVCVAAAGAMQAGNFG